MTTSFRHVAIRVPDLRVAEAYYMSLFGLELLGREAEMDDGRWYTLPPDKGWEDADRAGIQIKMLALRKGEVVIALFAGEAPPGQLFGVGFTMTGPEIEAVRQRLPADCTPYFDRPNRFHFDDRYEIRWQLELPDYQFGMNAEADAGRWLEL